MRQMDQKTIAAIYHQKTKYYEAGMARFQEPLDWSMRPSPFKEYHTEKKVDLTPYLPLKNNPFSGEPIEAITEEPGVPFGLGVLSRLLYFTNGVTGILQYPSGETLAMRAAPTAGGLCPVEIYIAVRNLSILPDGIYNFQVNDHSLVPAWAGNFWPEFQQYCLEHEAIAHANLLFLMTAVFQRSTWRYQERAYRRILLDTGHVLGNLVSYAPEEGFTPYPIGRFTDSALNRLLFLEESKEGVLSVVALPQTPMLSHFSAQTAERSTQIQVSEPKGSQMDPLLFQLHRGSSITRAPDKMKPLSKKSFNTLPHEREPFGEKYTYKAQISLSGDPIEWHGGIGTTILLRRSTRAFTGGEISKKVLASLLEYAYKPPISLPRFHFSRSFLESYLVIQAVDGLEEGVYYYTPETKEIHFLYAGDFKNKTWHFCLGQDLARDAAALVIHTAHLENAMAYYGNRAYRYLHIDAGHIGERMNLAAIQLGIGVSGIGGFYDDNVNALLSLSLDQIIVYITTLGQARGNIR